MTIINFLVSFPGSEKNKFLWNDQFYPFGDQMKAVTTYFHIICFTY